MLVLPPIPDSNEGLQDFLLEIAHIINTGGKNGYVARVKGNDFDSYVRSCYLRYNDDYDEMEFVVFDEDFDNPIWTERISSIKIATFDNGFWLELAALTSESSIVLFAAA